ncbi:MAG: IS5 family transposase [Planctomycetaceae bacterium]
MSETVAEAGCRRHLFARKKGGLEVGKTKKGKGTKLMLMTDGQGVPMSAMTTSAQDAEVNTIETLVDVRMLKKCPRRLLYDKAADADWLRDTLQKRGIEQITPHRSGRKRDSRQDGRALRRYRHRWKIERTISWLQYQRRLLVRHERHAHLFEGFAHLACMILCLRWF